jgi:hypothetical protein
VSADTREWFYEYGFIASGVPEGDDPIFAAIEAAGGKFVYGGGQLTSSGWQGYPAELEALAARCDALENALREIDKLDGRYNDINTARYLARAALAATDKESS